MNKQDFKTGFLIGMCIIGGACAVALVIFLVI
jgi:hypothetical protein